MKMTTDRGVTFEELHDDDDGTYTTSLAMPAVWQKQLKRLAIAQASKTGQFVTLADMLRTAIAEKYGFQQFKQEGRKCL